MKKYISFTLAFFILIFNVTPVHANPIALYKVIDFVSKVGMSYKAAESIASGIDVIKDTGILINSDEDLRRVLGDKTFNDCKGRFDKLQTDVQGRIQITRDFIDGLDWGNIARSLGFRVVKNNSTEKPLGSMPVVAPDDRVVYSNYIVIYSTSVDSFRNLNMNLFERYDVPNFKPNGTVDGHMFMYNYNPVRMDGFTPETATAWSRFDSSYTEYMGRLDGNYIGAIYPILYTNVPELSHLVKPSSILVGFMPNFTVISNDWVEDESVSIPYGFPSGGFVYNPSLHDTFPNIGSLPVDVPFVPNYPVVGDWLDDSITSGDIVGEGDIIGDDVINPPIDIPTDWSWWKWLVDWCTNFFDNIAKVISDVFIPSPNYFNGKLDSLMDKYPLLSSANDLFTRFNRMFNSFMGNEIPKIDVWLNKHESSKYDYGQHAYALDMTWYARYKPIGDSLISGVLWLTFLWNLYSKMPSIISGMSSVEVNLSKIDKYESKKARKK